MEELTGVAVPDSVASMPHAGLAPLTAVIDLGSNSVRMVVFAGAGRAPVPVYNERTLCGLGRSLGLTGKLDPEGRDAALKHLARFAMLAGAMGVGRIEALATEAVRVAADGPDFVAEAEAILGAPITILAGAREAETSAFGVISGIPDADGMMGDLGGGSLEIVALDGARPGAHATLPIGALRLHEAVGNEIAKAAKRVDDVLATVKWIKQVKGRTFYPVGGAWRAFAMVHMGQVGYPLHVVHQYTMTRGEALDLLRLVMRMGQKSLSKLPHVPKARLKTLPLAAVVLERLLEAAKPDRLVFSAFGLREGWLYGRLPEDQRRLDPLLVAAADIAARESRFFMPGDELDRWLDPIFADAEPHLARLRRAAVLLSDIAWRDHPDYRARDSFARVLHLPLANINHAQRVLLAFMVSASYGGGRTGPNRSLVHPLIRDADLEHAITVGRALRFARTLSGGTREVLRHVRLEVGGGILTARVSRAAAHLMSDEVTRRFEVVARRLALKPRVVEE